MKRPRMKCFECFADIEDETQYTINGHKYCEDCADVIADEEFSGLTTAEKVDCLGGDIKPYY